MFAAVWNGEELSEWFKCVTVVRQGCVLSLLLFALFLDDLHEWLSGGIDVDGCEIRVLIYADDVVLFVSDPASLQRMIRLQEYCLTWGIEVNLTKS